MRSLALIIMTPILYIKTTIEAIEVFEYTQRKARKETRLAVALCYDYVIERKNKLNIFGNLG